jgi:radical SAM superfamily enzyme YgiQ (UPF0313 family)
MSDVIFFQPHGGTYELVSKQLPLGLLSISTFLDREGYKVRIIDQRVEKNWEKKLKRGLKKRPICFGLTCMTGQQILNALEVSKLVKKESDVPVVWGGPHPTVMPEQTLENENIDIVLRGEGEITTDEVVKCLESEKPLNNVKGIFFKDEKGEMNRTEPRPPLDLNKLPTLPYHLVDVKKYSILNMGRIFSIESSRGCPYRCTFCYVGSNEYTRIWRGMSAEKIIENVRIVVEKFGADGIDFVDYNFFVDLKRVKRMVDLLKKEKMDITWNCEGARIDTMKRMDHGFLNSLEKSGLRWMAMGVESGSERILKLLNKGMSVEDVIRVNKKLSEHKLIIPQYNFMCAIPTETIEDLKRTTDLILKLLKDNIQACFQPLSAYIPYPGTELFNLAVKHGFDPPSRLEDWVYLDYPSWLKRIPWLSGKERNMMEVLYFSSLFVDDKANLRLWGNSLSVLVRIFSQFYRPIARIRLKHYLTCFSPEVKLMKLTRFR